MAVRRPTVGELRDLAKSLGYGFEGDDLDAYGQMVSEILEAYDTVEQLQEPVAVPRYGRTPGEVPRSEDNPLGAWVRRLVIEGAPDGPLHGKRVAIKDTIAIAGVPFTAGAKYLEGTVPNADATVVERILDAGGTIVGIAACEYLTLSGGSHSGSQGVVHNPRRRGYSAGGSSSGNAAAIGGGDADLAVGTDQGGSVRIPASWCGIVGLKPTYGLIPYTGIMPIEWTIDHAGPMSATVADNALLLSAIAGPDGIDDRQPDVPPGSYSRSLGAPVAGIRIGVLAEAFEVAGSEPETGDQVRAAAARLAARGASVETMSFPLHRDARSIWTPAFIEGLVDTMLMHNGAGSNHRARYDSGVSDAFARWRSNADEFSPSVKAVSLAAMFMRNAHSGRYYGKSQNLIRSMREQYDRLLDRYDLLLMPTTPHRAQPLPPADSDDLALWHASLGMNINTAPFCATGHPAISVPCGSVDGLPVGLMLVGRMRQEELLYQVASAVEEDWA